MPSYLLLVDLGKLEEYVSPRFGGDGSTTAATVVSISCRLVDEEQMRCLVSDVERFWAEVRRKLLHGRLDMIEEADEQSEAEVICDSGGASWYDDGWSGRTGEATRGEALAAAARAIGASQQRELEQLAREVLERARSMIDRKDRRRAKRAEPQLHQLALQRAELVRAVGAETADRLLLNALTARRNRLIDD